MLQKENQWFVLHFGINHFVHKNLTIYFLSRSIFIIVSGQKRGSKPVRFSSSPHHTSEGREDIFFLCSQNRARKKPGNRMVSGFFGAISFLVAQCGCGGRIWTCGLRVMSPTSYRTAPLRDIWLLNYNTTPICLCQYPFANDFQFNSRKLYKKAPEGGLFTETLINGCKQRRR